MEHGTGRRGRRWCEGGDAEYMMDEDWDEDADADEDNLDDDDDKDVMDLDETKQLQKIQAVYNILYQLK